MKKLGWPRNLYSGPGGGLSVGPGGGLYSGPGESYRSVIPPWHIFVKILDERALHQQADVIRKVFKSVGYQI